MNDHERAAGLSTVDLGEWPDPPGDDSADLVSSDLAAAATGTVYALLFVAVIIGAAVVFG